MSEAWLYRNLLGIWAGWRTKPVNYAHWNFRPLCANCHGYAYSFQLLYSRYTKLQFSAPPHSSRFSPTPKQVDFQIFVFIKVGKKNLMMKQISKNNSLLISPWKLTQALLRQQAASCSQWEMTQWPLTQHNVFQQFSTAPEMCVCVRERGGGKREMGPSSTILMSRSVNNELEGILKEAIEVLRYYPITYLRKTNNNFSSGRD